MRVIAGSAKSLALKTVPGSRTRPTTDRIKETLFNMLLQQIEGCRFLDLFSGSGSIGIEALSRGAMEAYFVEKNKKAAACIKENLRFTHLEERGILLIDDAVHAIKQLEKEKKVFDIIFMDPPYDQELEKIIFEHLNQSNLIQNESIIIVEASIQTDFSYLEQKYEIFKHKKYKTNQHLFLRKKV